MKTIIAVLALALALSGCATRVETSTWVATEPEDPVKRTVVKHSWWLGLPAIAPMDSSIKDGDFEVETKSFNLPTFDIDTLFEKD